MDRLVEVSEPELPQVKKGDVRIKLEDGTLVITGKRDLDQNSTLVYGRFSYSFVIPNDARPAKPNTVFKKGLLTVHLTNDRKTDDQLFEGPRRAPSDSATNNNLVVACPPASPFPEGQNLNKNELRMKTPLTENKHLTAGNRVTQFAFPAPSASQVSLAGDFNSWDTKAGLMHKGPDGVWHLAVALKPGRYEYRFFADEVWFNDPASEQRVRNFLGTENCVRIV